MILTSKVRSDVRLH